MKVSYVRVRDCFICLRAFAHLLRNPGAQPGFWSTAATLVGQAKKREHYMMLHCVDKQFTLIRKE